MWSYDEVSFVVTLSDKNEFGRLRVQSERQVEVVRCRVFVRLWSDNSIERHRSLTKYGVPVLKTIVHESAWKALVRQRRGRLRSEDNYVGASRLGVTSIRMNQKLSFRLGLPRRAKRGVVSK